MYSSTKPRPTWGFLAGTGQADTGAEAPFPVAAPLADLLAGSPAECATGLLPGLTSGLTSGLTWALRRSLRPGTLPVGPTAGPSDAPVMALSSRRPVRCCVDLKKRRRAPGP